MKLSILIICAIINTLIEGQVSGSDRVPINGMAYENYLRAIRRKKMESNDTEWEYAIREVAGITKATHLRRFFAFICSFCQPASPVKLWSKFKKIISKDYMLKYDEKVAYHKALHEIEDILSSNGLNCKSADLPVPDYKILPTFRGISESFENWDVKLQSIPLNSEQKSVMNEILKSVDGKSPNKLFFVEAPGGCGKTFLYDKLIDYMERRSDPIVAAAWTGIAAQLLKNGRTLHNTFTIPFPFNQFSEPYIMPHSEQARNLKHCSIILIDEASMIPASAVDFIDKALRRLLKNDEPMGGKIVVFGGDFRQILPITRVRHKVLVMENCIQNTEIWKHVKILRLTKNMRVNPDEKKFYRFLLDLGNNAFKNVKEDVTDEMSMIRIPDYFISNQSLIEFVYGKRINTEDYNKFEKKAIVAPYNKDCTFLNNKILELIEGSKYIYRSVDSAYPLGNFSHKLSVRYMNSITPSGMPDHRLELKKGAIIMLLRNMDFKIGLVNGIRLVILNFYKHALKLKIISGVGKGEVVYLPRLNSFYPLHDVPFIMCRKQFPVKAAFAITIDKSQGQTFDRLGIYLSQSVFSHGQLYVAFSRVRSSKSVRIFINETLSGMGANGKKGIYTKNIVYKNVLC